MYGIGDHLYLHVLHPSVPPRRSSDLTYSWVRSLRRLRCSRCATGIRGRSKLGAMTQSSTLFRRLLSSIVRSPVACLGDTGCRSEEHTSELQSLMRTSYAVFCLKKTN